MKKTLIITGTILALIIILGIWQNNRTTPTVNHLPLKIGGILPLSGPVAILGENIKNGMEMAKSELEQSGDKIDIIYEDSQGTPEKGLTAFEKLNDLDKVDVVFSIFSRVSVPLVNVAGRRKTLLMMSIVSASRVTGTQNQAFRFYSDAKQYVDPHFAWISAEKYQKVALLRINDEFGADVAKVIKQNLKAKGIELAIEERYLPNATDFRTQLTKIKGSKPNAILFVGSVPGEITSALKQKKELGIEVDFIEASASLANIIINPALAKTLDQEGANLTEGVYAIAFPFTLGKTGSDFKAKYRKIYGQDPNYAAAFGYDMVKISAKANNQPGKSFSEKLLTLGQYESLNGPVIIKPNGEINPKTYSIKIENSQFVIIE